MSITFLRIYYIRSITVLLGIVMLLSCKTDLQEVAAITIAEIQPDMEGHDLVVTYSDSARIQYKVFTAEYLNFTEGEDKYEEFPQGIHIISYDKFGREVGSIKAKYAKKLEDSMLWEARDEVVIINTEGKKLETEQLFWDMKEKIIYTDRYAKLTDNGRILEGNHGLKSDQDMIAPEFYSITGQLEVEQNNP